MIAAALLSAAGCSSVSPSIPSLSALKSAPVVFVYEGLPHQAREADLLEQELKRTDITRIGEFSFYTPKVPASETQATRLKAILCNEDSYYTYTGEPMDCGPFHPDFAVAWVEGETVHQLLICFGCNQVQFLSNNKKLEYALQPKSELKQLLFEFGSKRPKE